MVTQKGLGKYKEAKEEIAQEEQLEPDVVEKVIDNLERRIMNNRRQPSPPPPEGSISVRKAAEKYGVSRTTISRWAKQGNIKTLQRTNNWLYLDDKSIQYHLDGHSN